jgi:hypothetical protein
MATEITEDLHFRLPFPDKDTFVLVRDGKVYNMILEERTDFGHSMADGLEVSSKPIVSYII